MMRPSGEVCGLLEDAMDERQRDPEPSGAPPAGEVPDEQREPRETRPVDAVPPAGRGRPAWLVTALAALCAAVIVVGGIVAYRAYQHGRTVEQAKAAEARLVLVTDRLATLEHQVAAVDPEKSAQMIETLDEADGALDSVDEGLTSARQAVTPLEGSTAGAAYRVAVAEAAGGLVAMRGSVTYGQALTELHERAHEALLKTEAADDLVDSANEADARRAHRTAAVDAAQASRLYAEGERVFADISRLEPSSDMSAAAAWSGKSRARADLIAVRAVLGARGNSAAYAASASRIVATTRAIDAMTSPPLLVDGPWGKPTLLRLTGGAAGCVARSDAAVARAHELLGRGRY
jgi:hypothetical protein